MKFVFPFLGKTREKFIEEGIREYTKRLSRFVEMDVQILKNKPASTLPDEQFKQQESEHLLGKIINPSFVVALDNSGQTVDSPRLAEFIHNWENQGVQTVYFLIGGHLGLHSNVIKQANMVLSLSELTFTHEMCRMILLEQLYRAWMIKSGQKYHN